MSDHGHVFPRPDGVKARCGGPALCAECKQDLVAKNAQEQVPSKESSICYCGAYGGGKHTRSARCDGSPEPVQAPKELITAPENPTLDDLIAFYGEDTFRSGVTVRVPYRATREALERLLSVAKLASELCDAVDEDAEDIGGHRPVHVILGELGPAVDEALPR